MDVIRRNGERGGEWSYSVFWKEHHGKCSEALLGLQRLVPGVLRNAGSRAAKEIKGVQRWLICILSNFAALAIKHALSSYTVILYIRPYTVSLKKEERKESWK